MWTYVTTALPVILTGATWDEPVVLFTVNRYFLVYAICILFDFRDREDDKAAGIRSLITYLHEKGITILFYFSIAVAIASALGLLVLDFSFMHVVFLVIPVLITAFLYPVAKKNFSDVLYYLVLDGLMALSALFMLLYSAFKYFCNP
jgi:1,4-dihydroxy-2-naphthoate octaprenyltransferase